MRADGTRYRETTPLVTAIPYIMPKRYDAQNMATENIDEDILKNYIREKRKEGRLVTHMSVLATAYYKAVLRHPKLNCFIMNRKIYMRNHFCFSFVILKKRADGRSDETVLKVFLEPEDDVFSVSRKIQALIEKNAQQTHSNSTDKFANFMFAVPGLARLVVALVYFADRHGMLPRKIIDLSPFHTSLFITNLASINTSFIYHHCYEFGTTSVFLCMGKPVPKIVDGRRTGKLMPLGVVMDERIATGIEYSRFWATFAKYLKDPHLLETAGEETPAAPLTVGASCGA